jgi:hypothetical protein
MARAWALLAFPALLAGCGMAGTVTAGSSAAESAAQQAAQGRAAQDEVRRQIDAAYSQAAEQRHAAEADGQ